MQIKARILGPAVIALSLAAGHASAHRLIVVSRAPAAFVVRTFAPAWYWPLSYERILVEESEPVIFNRAPVLEVYPIATHRTIVRRWRRPRIARCGCRCRRR